MKKVLAIVIVLLMLAGCAKVKEVKRSGDESGESRFVKIEQTAIWRIVADKETRVMYAVSFGNYNCGTFTLLVDEDGKPLLWEGELE